MTAKDFLSYLISSLVQNPEKIEIEEKHDELGILLSLRVHEDDMGIVIGRWGRNIQAIKTIVRVFGSKKDERINIKIEEDNK